MGQLYFAATDTDKGLLSATSDEILIGAGPPPHPEPGTRSRGETLIATASWDKTARTWDTTTGQHHTTLTGHKNTVVGVAFSPRRHAHRHRLRRHDRADLGHRHQPAPYHPRRPPELVRSVAFSPDGTVIATASWDTTARIWDTATGQLRTTLTGHQNAVYGLAYSPDGALIATASWDKTARIWDSATGEHHATLTGHECEVWGVAFSPNGT